ncbi:MAG: hypothetical protein AAF518_17770 [Spirochaetota bacterium]
MTNTAKFHQDIELKSNSKIVNLTIESFGEAPDSIDPEMTGQVYFDTNKENFGIHIGDNNWKYSGEVDSLEGLVETVKLEKVYTIASETSLVGLQLNLSDNSINTTNSTTMDINTEMSSSMPSPALPSTAAGFTQEAGIQFFRNGVKLTKSVDANLGEISYVDENTIQINVPLEVDEQLSCLISINSGSYSKSEKLYTITTEASQTGMQINLLSDTASDSDSTTLTLNTEISTALMSPALPNSGSSFAQDASIQFFRNGVKLTKGSTPLAGDIGFVDENTIQVNSTMQVGAQLSCVISKNYGMDQDVLELNFLNQKGQLYTRSTSNNVQLAPGNNGQILTVDESSEAGLAWSNPSASPEQNYIKDSTAKSAESLAAWSTYNDLTAEIDNGQNDGAEVAEITLSQQITNPISGIADFQITKPGGSSHIGQGVAYDFQIERRHNARILQISVDYRIRSGKYQTEDLACYIIDNDSGEVIEPSNIHFENLDSKLTGRFLATFQTHIENVNYRLCFHIATDATREWSFVFNNVKIWEPQQSVGAIITDWQEYSLQVTATTTNPDLGTHTKNAYWRRNGSNCEVMFNIDQTSGGSDGDGIYLFSLPHAIDSSKIADLIQGSNYQTGINNLGTASTNNGTSGNGYVAAYNTIQVVLVVGYSAHDAVAVNSSFFQAGHSGQNHYSAHFSYPVAGWGSTVTTMQGDSQRPVYVEATADYQQSITKQLDTAVTFNQVHKDSHGAWNDSTFTAPKAGFYLFSAYIMYASSVSGASAGWRIYNRNDKEKKQTKSDTNTVREYSRIEGFYLEAGEKARFITSHVTGSAVFLNGSPTKSLTITEISNQPSSITTNETVACRYTHNGKDNSGSAVTIPYGGGHPYTTVDYPTKDYDTHGAYSNGVFTCPEAGFYRIQASILLTGRPSEGIVQLMLYKNGELFQYGDRYFASAHTQDFGQSKIADLVKLEKGDTISIKIYQVIENDVPISDTNKPNSLLSISKEG